MKNVFKLSAIILALGSLTACSSGDSSTDVTIRNKVASSNTVRLLLAPEGTATKTTYNKGETILGMITGTNNANSSYGAWQASGGDEHKYLAYQGVATTNANIDKLVKSLDEATAKKGESISSAIATYKGNAVWIGSRHVTGDNPKVGGSTTLDVDLKAKQVLGGQISFNNHFDGRTDSITLAATRLENDASFAGKATSTSAGTGSYQGQLFGSAAQEMAGIATFKSNEIKDAVAFGGTRGDIATK